MLAIISPAKTLDFTSPLPVNLPAMKAENFSDFQPRLLAQSEQLIDICRQLSPTQIASLMSISDKLAGLNAARFAQWCVEHNFNNARQAIYAFKGDVYTGFDVDSLNAQDVIFAQDHLRILSGLYGLLSPLDLMQPYRLEMGTKLINQRGKDLYAFWGDLITTELQQALDAQGDAVLVNLASDEYYKSIQETKLKARIVKPVFLDNKGGRYKVVSFYAKKARGMMCRFMVQQRLSEVEQLKAFDLGGYWFDATSSNHKEWVFKRDLIA